MRSWLVAGAAALILLLIWGYRSGHCVLCKKLTGE